MCQESVLPFDVVTIDGPAGAGKSTAGRMLAARLGRLYLDTGAMYRAAALEADRQGISTHDGPALGRMCGGLDIRFQSDGDSSRIFVRNADVSLAIRTPEMDMGASAVSAHLEVREAMVNLQRRIAAQQAVVAEGRDMGTVVFPAARYKFFLTTSLEIRARRRLRERDKMGQAVSEEKIREDMRRRDHQDETRPLSPLKPAPDARIIDSGSLTPEAVVAAMMEHIHTLGGLL